MVIQVMAISQGRIASVLVTLDNKNDLLAAKNAIQGARFNSIAPTCSTALDAAEEPVDGRTIVISKIPDYYDIEAILNKIDQVSPVLSAEYVMKYENPRPVQTDELLAVLRDPEFFSEIPLYLQGKDVQIHESSADLFTVITLDNNYKPTKTEQFTSKFE
jgi:hypothetical protein